MTGSIKILSPTWTRLFLVILFIWPGTILRGQDLTFERATKLGTEAFRSGRYEEAKRYFRLSLEAAEQEPGADTHIVVALGNVAEQFRLTGNTVQAEKVFERAVRIMESSSTVDQRHFPVILGNQALLFLDQGKYGLAESTLKEALRATEREHL